MTDKKNIEISPNIKIDPEEIFSKYLEWYTDDLKGFEYHNKICL